MYFLPFSCSLVSIPSQFPCSHLFLGVFEQLERRVLLRSASPHATRSRASQLNNDLPRCPSIKFHNIVTYPIIPFHIPPSIHTHVMTIATDDNNHDKRSRDARLVHAFTVFLTIPLFGCPRGQELRQIPTTCSLCRMLLLRAAPLPNTRALLQQKCSIRTASSASSTPTQPHWCPLSSFSNSLFSQSNANALSPPPSPDPCPGVLLTFPATLHLRFSLSNGNSTLSMAHAAADDNVMATLGLDAHNSRLQYCFSLSSAGRRLMVFCRLADEGKEKDGFPAQNLRFLGSDTSNRASVISSFSFVSLSD